MSLKARIAEGTVRVSPSLHQSAEPAASSPGDGTAAVSSTSRMVELMETAAARLMKPHLRDGETSVSISTNVTHAARSTLNGLVRAVATPGGISGRVHRFTIHAFDENGLIGSAEHARAVVAEKRVVSMARQRVAQPLRIIEA